MKRAREDSESETRTPNLDAMHQGQHARDQTAEAKAIPRAMHLLSVVYVHESGANSHRRHWALPPTLPSDLPKALRWLCDFMPECCPQQKSPELVTAWKRKDAELGTEFGPFEVAVPTVYLDQLPKGKSDISEILEEIGAVPLCTKPGHALQGLVHEVNFMTHC